MAQLRGKGGGQAGMGGVGGYGGYQQMDPEQQKAQQERQKAAEDQRTQILKAILSPQARERLSNIAMVKKDKARKVEDMLIMNAQRGAIGGQIDEAQLIEMLESINEQTEKETKVTFQRRRIDDDW
uniref:Programmed cell death protein 5 n=3 Tax=Guillardia theta TaxID=55529 RepID=A0A7S4P753_GUITH|mmetsp:Transcript_44408/g.140145  ORF Transcript_44408/g.140145 Transcript_44408/m.140145 type:complete len:126 (+) Transcript_44408:548-925(+)